MNKQFQDYKHAYLVESFIKGTNLQDAEVKAEAWADASMRRLSDIKEPALEPEGEPEINVDNIPFN